MEGLPIYQVIDDLRNALSKNNTVILQAPPGAGKSTVLPLHLLNEPWLDGKKILLLEPRRLAAKAVANRLAEQLGETAGKTVGYRIRFDQKISTETRIEIVTEGILTRMLQRDNSLQDYGLVMFDEFHERSLHADLALALCREMQAVLRNDLLLLIMSATLDGKLLQASLNNAPLIVSEGRQYPIKYHYREWDHSISIAQNTCKAIIQSLREEHGDLLVFLPGSGDIHRAKELLEDANVNAVVYSLYGDLPPNEQQRALLPDSSGRRKIVLSTSIAETSLTIQGVRVVIDSGYSRIPSFDPSSGLTRLETVQSSKDTADQRAGRAGRTEPGVCYRLWPESTLHHLNPQRIPEILQADLSPLMLELAGWGNNHPDELHWITPPPAGAIQQARILLEELGALHENKITKAGKALLELPTHPRIAHLLIKGKAIGQASLACDVAALLEEKDPLRNEAGTDLMLRLEMLIRWRNRERINVDKNLLERIDRISLQWRKFFGCTPLHDVPDMYIIGELVAAAYPERIAKKENQDGRYRLANGKSARLPQHDPLQHAEWIVISQMDAGIKEGKIFLATAFDPAEMIRTINPTENIGWNYATNTIVARKEWRIGKLITKEEPLKNPDSALVATAVADFIRKEGLYLFERTIASEQLQARIASIAKWNTDSTWPDMTDDGLIDSLATWALPFLGIVRKKEDLKKLNLSEMILSRLDWSEQELLHQLAPEKIEVPSGSLISIEYSQEGQLPVLPVRLQEVFGWKETPRINKGKTPLVMHLLSPGFKPVQVTKDLHSFWENTYHEVRKELRIRYPKHSWPEDPWTATAVRGAVRKKI